MRYSMLTHMRICPLFVHNANAISMNVSVFYTTHSVAAHQSMSLLLPGVPTVSSVGWAWAAGKVTRSVCSPRFCLTNIDPFVRAGRAEDTHAHATSCVACSQKRTKLGKQTTMLGFTHCFTQFLLFLSFPSLKLSDRLFCKRYMLQCPLAHLGSKCLVTRKNHLHLRKQSRLCQRLHKKAMKKRLIL